MRPAPLRRSAWLIVLSLVLAACTAAPANTPSPTATPFTGTPRPVIIDTDMAVDDWLTILYLLQRQDLAVQAITVTGAGEAHCEPGVRHALDLAALAGQPDILVACGRETPLRGDHVFPTAWRTSVDRLLGLRLPENPGAPAAQAAPALITALAGDAPAPLTVLTLGPLTNVAEALAGSPALAGQLDMIYVMGGAVDVPGNLHTSGAGLAANTVAEWNVYVDPYAANVVLESGAPVTLIPLDATNQVPVTTAFYDRLAAQHATPEAQFVYDALTAQRGFLEAGGYYFWDPLAASLLADESLGEFTTRPLSVVEAEGPNSGQLVTAEGAPTVRFATTADPARFEAQFLEVLNAQWP